MGVRPQAAGRAAVAAQGRQLCYWIGIDPSHAWVIDALREYVALGARARGRGPWHPAEVQSEVGEAMDPPEDVLGRGPRDHQCAHEPAAVTPGMAESPRTLSMGTCGHEGWAWWLGRQI